MKEKLRKLEESINTLKKNSSYDTEGAITSLADQLNTLRMEFESQNALYERLADTLDALEAKMGSSQAPSVFGNGELRGSHSYFTDDAPQAPNSTRFLVE